MLQESAQIIQEPEPQADSAGAMHFSWPQDWRIQIALVVSLLWIVFLAVYIARNVGWGSFMDLPIDEMGAFLEGAFAFLAFLWLVIGLFIQQSVLAENNEELRRNNLHSAKQTQAIAATEMNARQETFFKISEATRRQLGAIAGLLFMSSQGPVGNGSYRTDQIREVWQQFAQGDSEVWSRLFLSMGTPKDIDFADLFYGTEIRRSHSENFVVGFDRLIKLARGCDSDNIIMDSLIFSAHGLLNVRMRELHPTIKFPEIVMTNSQNYLNSLSDSLQQ
ncbi:MAG: hypothetical protein CMQ14_03060 [Gammaproteobacteria bacterium]|nr:hypothetical protein [Gammaproteobacteria bacterium]|tara:strand:- start:1550 stop:2380 length:831 start_codon:yes stop_codon:yes gene_type:complete